MKYTPQSSNRKYIKLPHYSLTMTAGNRLASKAVSLPSFRVCPALGRIQHKMEMAYAPPVIESKQQNKVDKNSARHVSNGLQNRENRVHLFQELSGTRHPHLPPLLVNQWLATPLCMCADWHVVPKERGFERWVQNKPSIIYAWTFTELAWFSQDISLYILKDVTVVEEKY